MDRDCADGLYCNGVERCDPQNAAADVHGCVGDASGPCGNATCDEGTRSCAAACPAQELLAPCGDGGSCDDGIFCNGDEACVDGWCMRTPRDCGAGLSCVEADRVCVKACTSDAQCSDGLFCNGAEGCFDGRCGNGALPCVTQAACSESLHRCTRCTTQDDCQDGDWCNGAERCSFSGGVGTCLSALFPRCAAGEVCNAAMQRCEACQSDADCDDGIFCNGWSTCVSGTCVDALPPCDVAACHEATRTCTPSGAGCVTDADCQDGLFCNGAERCNGQGTPGTDARGCGPSLGQACGLTRNCDEGRSLCVLACSTDADGDGHRSRECGGDDCDDHDPMRFPGQPEICPSPRSVNDLHDEDCDPATVAGATDGDADGDGYISAACCNLDAAQGGLHCGNDCDDTRADVHPGATEICDGVDNNCDGQVDEGVRVTAYFDADGDGAGSAACARQVCTGWPGFVSGHGDCNDGDPLALPAGQQCGSGTDPRETWVCINGTWTASQCGASQSCVGQPSGVGVCQ